MRNLSRATGLFLALWIGSGALASSQPPQRPPDSEEGVIDGRGALMAVPISVGGGSPRRLDPKGLEVHLKPVDDPNVELVYPAGTWVLPPSGRYLYWLQGGGRMTPYAGLFGYSGNVAAGMTVSAALGDAGRVALSPQAEAGPDTVLELLHAGNYTEAGFLRWELLRRKSLDELGEGMLMPAGPTIGALWNRTSQRYEALSLPFDVPGRQAVEVPLQRPQGVAQLVAQLQRHEAARDRGEGDARIVLKREGKEVPPDARVHTASRIFAFWYRLTPGPAELRVEANDDTVFESPRLTLEAGKIENVTGRLRPYPALKVQLDLPGALREEKLALEVRRLPSEEVVAQQDLKKDAHSHHFEKVPPTLLAVDLKTPFGVFTREVDLSSGEDGSVLLDPELITLRGIVYRGDKETPAKLTFTTTGRKELETEADEEGLYEIVVLQPLRMVSIELPGAKVAPYIDFFTRPVAESQEMDFHLSDAEVRVKVSDAATGRPIQKASLAVRNNYVVPDEDQNEEQDPPKEKEKAVFQSVVTDQDGLAWLPPLRKGSIEVRATAAGYLPLREPLKAGIADETTDQEFEIRLDPAGESAALRLRLPSGEPAANAEVLLIDSLATVTSLFSARADADGLVEPPSALAGVLLVKHPNAAYLIREWQAPEAGDEIEWTLPPAAERPLTVRVLDSTGRSPAPRVALALTIEGRRLFDRVLAWLTGAPPMTDANGYWTGKNLPRAPLTVLAWGPELQRDAAAGLLDAHATGVEVPWPEPVEVRAVE